MTFRHGSRALLALASAALLAAGCTRIRDHQGYLVDEPLVAAIQPGVDNRDSVAGTLGRPTFVGQFDQRDWYYVSRNTRQLAFNMPRPTEQTVLHVRFDAAGNVETGRAHRRSSSSPISSRAATRRRRWAATAACSRSCSAISARSARAAAARPTADNPQLRRLRRASGRSARRRAPPASPGRTRVALIARDLHLLLHADQHRPDHRVAAQLAQQLGRDVGGLQAGHDQHVGRARSAA